VKLLTRGLILISLAVIASCVTPAPSSAPKPAQAPVRSADFETDIATFERTASQSPALLKTRLDYADFLLAGASGTCGQRLPQARFQLDRVTSSRAAQTLFPEGWSRAAELEYRISLADAACGDVPGRREHELQDAADAAQRAVSLYRAEFDYSSMAVMQFNFSVAEHVLGQNAVALSSLKSAIEMAREYGLRDAAQADYQLLLEWQHDAQGAQNVAALMQDFPRRSATLKFNWSASDATVATQLDHVRDWEGKLSRARGSRAARQQVRPDHRGWTIAYPEDSGDFVPGVWPAGESETHPPDTAFRPQLLSFPGFDVSGKGELRKIVDTAAFSRRVTAETAAQIRRRAPQGAQVADLLKFAIASMQVAFGRKAIEIGMRADYNLQTAMWIDATLQQGVPYEIIATLPIPGLSLVLLNQRLQFLYTHDVPCTPKTTESDCIEIIVHIAPEVDSLAATLDLLEDPDHPLHYSGGTTVRIVTDPKTLTPYVFDARSYWYLALDPDDPDGLSGDQEVIESQRMVRTVTYAADSPR
jgi:hypothetical protein